MLLETCQNALFIWTVLLIIPPLLAARSLERLGKKPCFCQPWLTEKMLFYGSLISCFNTSVAKWLMKKKTTVSMVRKFFPLTFNALVSRFQTNFLKIRKTVVTRVGTATSHCYLFSKYMIGVLGTGQKV